MSPSLSVRFLECNGVVINGHQVRLTKQERHLVEFLAAAKGKVRTTRMILAELYLNEPAADQKIIDVLVCKLRKGFESIASGAGEQIRTVWGRGYAWGALEESETQHPSLPKIDRWVISRKEKILTNLWNGVVGFDDVLVHYPDMSAEELAEWLDLYQKHSRRGLRITRTETYR